MSRFSARGLAALALTTFAGLGALPLAASDLALERRVLVGDVAQYSFTVPVGNGPFEQIRLHRVVRERAPYVPVRTADAVLLAHGDVWGFNAAFLAAANTPGVPDSHALPVFLAQRGVDVWGIDFRWTLVPAATPDLSFMADWGITTDARDLRLAVGIARTLRGLSGSGTGPMNVLGWSRGGQIGYAALSSESQLPRPLRQIKGFIPVDIYLKTDVEILRQGACTRLAGTEARIAGGETAESLGQLVTLLGGLGSADPGGASPVLPGFNNRQAALLVGVGTFSFFPPGLAPVPHYHFNGGTFDGGGLPASLLYTREDLFLTFLAGGAPWQPLRELAEGDAAICDDPALADVPFDDHLEDVTVPVLYVGAAGGFGASGVYTTSLLGSTDVTHLVVSRRPPSEVLADIGHADIFSGEDAPTLFWQPILDWLRAH